MSIVVNRLLYVHQVEAERESGADSERFPPMLHSGKQWGQDEQVSVVMVVALCVPDECASYHRSLGYMAALAFPLTAIGPRLGRKRVCFAGLLVRKERVVRFRAVFFLAHVFLGHFLCQCFASLSSAGAYCCDIHRNIA